MFTSLITVQSCDIFIAATNAKTKQFTHAVKSNRLAAAEFARIYEVLINIIDDEATRQQVLANTDGKWSNAAFPLELLELTDNYARVVLGGVVCGGYMFDITARDWLRLEAKSCALLKAA